MNTPKNSPKLAPQPSRHLPDKPDLDEEIKRIEALIKPLESIERSIAIKSPRKAMKLHRIIGKLIMYAYKP